MTPKSEKLSTLQPFPPGEAARQGSASFLAREYTYWRDLYEAQPASIQRFFESQARTLASMLLQPVSQAQFRLPDRVVASAGDSTDMPLPPEQREQMVGGFLDRLTRTGIGAALRQRLDELEASTQAGVAASAGLVRFTSAMALVHDLLPSGRSVRYLAAEGEEIPSIPPVADSLVGSALTAASDAMIEDGSSDQDAKDRGELIVPYVPAARRFFLPQWVAFDDQDGLLVNTTAEAEAHIASMQGFVRILHAASSLAPYMIADETYQQKRYGMLGQLVNQGRALARFQTRAIIATIRRRAIANDLNRGLSLSLPYFDDQDLELKTRDFDIIPAGRIMFIPTFVVLAANKELAKVEQDTRLSRSTRNHLAEELRMLESAFQPSGL